MKLRIKGNSLRLRLTRSEVAQLATDDFVTETIQFGVGDDAELEYAVQSQSNAEEITVRFNPGRIAVIVPYFKVAEWAADEEMVGISAENDVGGLEPLRILIEKDFVCLSRDESGFRSDGEDDSDAYPHPNAALGLC